MNISQYSLDVAFVVVVIATTVFVARRLMIESAIAFLAVTLATLISMTLFEPVADWCRAHLFAFTDIIVSRFLWFFFALFLFGLSLFALLRMFLAILPEIPTLGRRTESIGGWIFGGLTGYILAAFLLTVLHTLPGPRNFWGIFEPDAQQRPGPVMAFAPDYQFLSLVDYICIPRGALSGSPRQLAGPLLGADLKKGRWASYPVRYAIWREKLTVLFADDSETDDEFYQDPVYDDVFIETPEPMDGDTPAEDESETDLQGTDDDDFSDSST